MRAAPKLAAAGGNGGGRDVWGEIFAEIERLQKLRTDEVPGAPGAKYSRAWADRVPGLTRAGGPGRL